MKRILIGWLIFLACFSLGTADAGAESKVKCTAVSYCETELKLSDQKAPIVYDGSGDWLNAVGNYFDIEVQLVNGTAKEPLTDAKLIYACSADGVTFDSCQQGAFIEVGTYTLRVSVEADDSRYYLPVYADTKVTVSDAAALKGLTIQYSGEGAASGTAVEDWESYQAGDSAIILGNFGIDASGNPDPLVRPGYELVGWRESGGDREFSFGDTVVMQRSLRLVPIWSDGSADVPVTAAGSFPEAAAAQPNADRAEAIRADAVQFFPVRSDGDRSDPVLLNGGKTVPTGAVDPDDIASRPQSRVLDGFFTPDGEETRLIIRRVETNAAAPLPVAAPAVTAEEIAPAFDTAAETPAGQPEEASADAVAIDPPADNPFETDAAVEMNPEMGSIGEAVAVQSEEASANAVAIDSPADNPFEAGAAVEMNPEMDSIGEAAAESESIAPDTAIAAAETGLDLTTGVVERASANVEAVPFALPTPAAKQILPIPNPPANQDWDGFDVRLPETGLRLKGDEPVERLDPVGMVLELPAYGVKANIVVVPFAGNTWDVRRLRDEAGVLEGFDLPGEGVSILAGHNHLGSDDTGPFLTIGLLEVGDRIFVHKADETLLMFEVYENMLVQPDEFGTIESLSIANPGSIVLVTCENETVDGGYSHRRAVFAKPIFE